MISVRSMAAAVFGVISLLAAAPPKPPPQLPLRIPPLVPAIVLTALRDANATNDYRRFDGALAVAKFVAGVMPLGAERNAFRGAILIYQDVGIVLTFAMRDRYGAYYNDDSLPGLRDRLNADYPGYDNFIAEYRVADGKGNVLYPTAETRRFLLQQLTAPP
jgi:hypothetical protein